jgi:hypothetical protein
MVHFLKNFSKAKIFFFLGLLIFLSSCFRFSHAQQSPAEGITISPPINELTINPGQEIVQKILVTNPTENLLELYPSVMNFEAAGEGGEPNFYPPAEEARKFAIARWISLSQSKIALSPRQEISFEYTIKVPSDAEPGGHYGVVFLGTKPPEINAGASQVSIASQVGSLILVRVPGDITEEAALEEFSAPWFYFKPPVPFSVFIRNKGNTHFKPEGEITIRSWGGKEVERIPINPKNGNVLPDSRRRFDTNWLPTSSFWRIPVGRFSADLRTVYGSTDKTLDGKLYFWILPWWFIITVLTLIIIIIYFLIRRKRKRKKGGNDKKRNPPANNIPQEKIVETLPYNAPEQKQSNPPRPPRRYI